MEAAASRPDADAACSKTGTKPTKSRSKVWEKVAWFTRRSRSRDDPAVTCLENSNLSDLDKSPLSGVSPAISMELYSSSESDSFEELDEDGCRVNRSNLYPNSEIIEQHCLKPSVAKALFLQMENSNLHDYQSSKHKWKKRKSHPSETSERKASVSQVISVDEASALVRTVSLPDEVSGAGSGCHCAACCTCSPAQRLMGVCPAHSRLSSSTASLDRGLATSPQQDQQKLGMCQEILKAFPKMSVKEQDLNQYKSNSLPLTYSRKCKQCHRVLHHTDKNLHGPFHFGESVRQAAICDCQHSINSCTKTVTVPRPVDISKTSEFLTAEAQHSEHTRKNTNVTSDINSIIDEKSSDDVVLNEDVIVVDNLLTESDDALLTFVDVECSREDKFVELDISQSSLMSQCEPCSDVPTLHITADDVKQHCGASQAICDIPSDKIPESKSILGCSNQLDTSLGKNSNLQAFKQRREAMVSWFSGFSDEQRNLVLLDFLATANVPQLHLLSVQMTPRMHEGCPHNCQDLVSWLPPSLSLFIFSLLDPVSLCRASAVCRAWAGLAQDPGLWRHFCCERKWRLSLSGEQKQLLQHMMPDGKIAWIRVFAERFRLRNNWLRGRCYVRTFEGHTQGISCVQFDDTRIVSGSSDKTIKVWNIRTNSPWLVQTLVGHSGTVRCLHLQGNRLVSGSTDRTIKVWDLSTQQSWSSIACKVTMVGHLDTVRCLQVDDEKVISGSYDRTLKVWDIRHGRCNMTLRGHDAAVLHVQFDKNKIVSGSCDKTIKVWSLVSGECLMTLHGHHDAVTCLMFDDTRIVSGSLDCNLKFWDVHSGKCLNTIDWKASEGHTGVVRCLQADSWRVVSASDDRTIKVWNLETCERLVTLRNHTDGVTCLQFNDSIIVSGSYDKTVKLWDFSCC